MMGFSIAYDPCQICSKREMCSVCELTMRRNGAIKDEKQSEGEWIKPTSFSQTLCSKCRMTPKMLLGLLPKFCPNCGAKMKVAERDDDSEDDDDEQK